MSVVQWHDKRVVLMLTTLHDDSPIIEQRSRQAEGGQEVVQNQRQLISIWEV